MSFTQTFFWLRNIIVILAVLSTTQLYLYPIFFGCAFPSTSTSTSHGFKNTIALHRGHIPPDDPSVAPFRLLVLADPQLEGDSSLPTPEDALLAKLRVHGSRLWEASRTELREVAGQAAKEFILKDVPRSLGAIKKKLDLFGNDYYLAHIYRTLHWWTKPTHITVLGDLIGSQWVSDGEFEWRGWRYWNRVLAGSHKVDEELMNLHLREKEEQRQIPLESAVDDWSKKIVNIVGNHDIGYAGDISRERIVRFEATFGKVNWDVHFSYPSHRIPLHYNSTHSRPPSLHLVVLNSMILDTPALDKSIQEETFTYLNGLISDRLDPVEDRNTTFTLLLTHVPLHKPEGVCVDAPFFAFFEHDDEDSEEDTLKYKQGGLKEQNHLSEYTSHQGVLHGLFGMSGDQGIPMAGKGRNGLVLNGHDHEGCDVVHYIERIQPESSNRDHSSDSGLDPPIASEEDPHEKDIFDMSQDQSTIQNTGESKAGSVPSWSWKSVRTPDFRFGSLSNDDASLREVTLRSMMGEYSGNAGLLSIWYDFGAGNTSENGTWKYDIQMCPLGVQHFWWAIHVTDAIAILILLGEVTISWIWIVPKHSKSQATITPSKNPDTTLSERIDAKSERMLTVPETRDGENMHKRSPSQRRRKG